MTLPKKRRGGVPQGRIEILAVSRFVLPYLVPGCHTFGSKIAAAALRPRNDTELERFYWDKNVFGHMQSLYLKDRRFYPYVDVLN